MSIFHQNDNSFLLLNTSYQLGTQALLSLFPTLFSSLLCSILLSYPLFSLGNLSESLQQLMKLMNLFVHYHRVTFPRHMVWKYRFRILTTLCNPQDQQGNSMLPQPLG